MKLKNQWNKKFETRKMDVRKEKKDPQKLRNRDIQVADGTKASRKEIAFSKKVNHMKTDKPRVDKYGNILYGTSKYRDCD